MSDTTCSHLFTNGSLVIEGVAGSGKSFLAIKYQKKITTLIGIFFDFEKRKINFIRDTNAYNLLSEKNQEIAKNLFPDIGQIADMDNLTPEVLLHHFVMHPSSTYEEVVGGIKIKPTKKGQFKFTKGFLLETIFQACRDMISQAEKMEIPRSHCIKNHLVVLDEINRCNLPSVLGELLYLLEPNRRIKLEKIKEVIKENGNFDWNNFCYLHGGIVCGFPVFYPSNLFIVGTMNSSDRSILSFDQAMRRRFPPFRQEPMDGDQLKNSLGLNEKQVSLITNHIKAWSNLNEFLKENMGPDAMIGHSYWFSAMENQKRLVEIAENDTEALEQSVSNAWRFEILPQIIHSAETYRKERDVHDLFNENEEAKEWLKPITELKIGIKLIGVNHGAKLIVEMKNTNKIQKSSTNSQEESKANAPAKNTPELKEDQAKPNSEA